MTTLYVRDEEGFEEASEQEVLLEAQELIEEKFRRQFQALSNPDSVRLFLKIRLGGREHEVFAALFLDSHLRLIEYVELFRGTIDESMVHPREVVKEALDHNAAAVIFAHNHPSGVARPSKADETITNRLTWALEVIGVEVVDHLVVGESIASFHELGLLWSPFSRQKRVKRTGAGRDYRSGP